MKDQKQQTKNPHKNPVITFPNQDKTPTQTPHKQCVECLESKPLDSFPIDRRCEGGHKTCLKCLSKNAYSTDTFNFISLQLSYLKSFSCLLQFLPNSETPGSMENSIWETFECLLEKIERDTLGILKFEANSLGEYSLIYCQRGTNEFVGIEQQKIPDDGKAFVS